VLFSDVEHYPRTRAYPLSGTTAVSALAYLRQTFPKVIEPPQFIPRPRALPAQPDWLSQLLGWLGRNGALVVAVAVAAIALATAIPALATVPESAPPATAVVRSSAIETGTSATRTQDLGASTFVGGVAFLQQSRDLNAALGNEGEVAAFVEGSRQASLVSLLQDVSGSVTLPYLSDTAATTAKIVTWDQALEDARHRAAIQAARNRLPGRSFRATPVTPGTRIGGANVTFYACVGNGFCGTMASGVPVFDGAAACSSNLPFGTRFVVAADPTGRTFTCLDRGMLSATWVDVWFYDAADGWAWQSLVGSRSDIIIVE